MKVNWTRFSALGKVEPPCPVIVTRSDLVSSSPDGSWILERQTSCKAGSLHARVSPVLKVTKTPLSALHCLENKGRELNILNWFMVLSGDGTSKTLNSQLSSLNCVPKFLGSSVGACDRKPRHPRKPQNFCKPRDSVTGVHLRCLNLPSAPTSKFSCCSLYVEKLQPTQISFHTTH